jgi:aspartate aminotransferase
VLQRSEISNPPSHGARLVENILFVHDYIKMILQMNLILNDAELFEEWKKDIRTMAGRIIEMRRELHRQLTEVLRRRGTGITYCVRSGCSASRGWTGRRVRR